MLRWYKIVTKIQFFELMNPELTTQQALRYSRQILLSGFDLDKQEILSNSSALVIGVGGLGCAASQYLAASGIGKLTLIDDDVVELTNLQRQVLHTEQSVGKSKVESAVSALQKLNSDVELCSVNERLAESELRDLIVKHTIVLDCTDNLASRNLINRACYQTGIPLISGAAIRMEGQIFSVDPRQKTACYACISHFFTEQSLSCVESGVMSPIVGIIGSTQALEAIKIVTGFGKPMLNRLQLFDGMNGSWHEMAVTRRDECPVCGS